MENRGHTLTRVRQYYVDEDGSVEPNSVELYSRLDIYPSEGYNTGILDSSGNYIYKERERIGFRFGNT